MRRFLVLLISLTLLLAAIPLTALASSQLLPELSYKYYPLRDIVFVDFHNPYFTPMDNIIINMTVREGTGRNRVVAIGQLRMPAGLVLMPGEHTSARVPIRARVVRELPALSQFEFRIFGQPVAEEDVPPDIVVQDSSNGITLEMNRDLNGVPFVMGFVGLSPMIVEETTAQVDAAMLTFYDQNQRVVWSEIMPINGRLGNGDSIMLWGKFDQASSYLVPDITAVEAKFLTRRD